MIVNDIRPLSSWEHRLQEESQPTSMSICSRFSVTILNVWKLCVPLKDGAAKHGTAISHVELLLTPCTLIVG